MLNQIKKFIIHMMTGANIAAIILMLLVGFSYRLNPVEHPLTATVGLVFPVLLATNVAFLVLFLIFRKRLVIIPVAGLILCYIPIRYYSPINIPHATPDDAIKVMSYNVFMFNRSDSTGLRRIADYVNNSGAAIVCMQEADVNDYVKAAFAQDYKYIDSARTANFSESQIILSKYPILSKTRINEDVKGCLCVAYEVLVDGDRTTVLNCHLEGTGLTPEERKDFHKLVKGNWKSDTIGAESKRMIVRLGEASRRRAPQIEGIIKYINSRKGEPVLLFADINDTPISYCRDQLAKNLTDCYVSTGNGPGISYHYNTFYVRIDNIMCSADWQPYNFKVDRDIDVSDHYPIWGYIKKTQHKNKKSH